MSIGIMPASVAQGRQWRGPPLSRRAAGSDVAARKRRYRRGQHPRRYRAPRHMPRRGLEGEARPVAVGSGGGDRRFDVLVPAERGEHVAPAIRDVPGFARDMAIPRFHGQRGRACRLGIHRHDDFLAALDGDAATRVQPFVGGLVLVCDPDIAPEGFFNAQILVGRHAQRHHLAGLQSEYNFC
uniref:Uncharacterized protein n=1 Tax=Ralstonia solanacearum TaxID=305 RepID=A0A0S4TNU4_RALSL|nr:protein of unknown function [Ralstonia solanacearum]